MSDDLRRMTDDWGYFCEVVWGQTLHDWQKDILRRLVSDGSVMTRMTLKEGISGASVDCIIVDDVYEKPVEEGSAKCVITKRLRDSCYLAFDDGTNDYTTATQAADRIEALEKALRNAEPFLTYAYQQITEPRNPLPMKVALDEVRAALWEKKDD